MSNHTIKHLVQKRVSQIDMIKRTTATLAKDRHADPSNVTVKIIVILVDHQFIFDRALTMTDNIPPFSIIIDLLQSENQIGRAHV